MRNLLKFDPVEQQTAAWTDDVVYEVYKHDAMVSLPKPIIEASLRHLKQKFAGRKSNG
jgi:hypothetical protein